MTSSPPTRFISIAPNLSASESRFCVDNFAVLIFIIYPIILRFICFYNDITIEHILKSGS